MAGRYEVEITIAAAHDLNNVNWRNGDLCPYVVLWIDPAAKSSTRVATAGDDEDPVWDEKLTLPLPPGIPLEDAVIHLEVGRAEGVKPLVGSARLPLGEVVDEVGIGGKLTRKLKLSGPSERPQGNIEFTVAVKGPARYYDPYAAPSYGGSPPYARPTHGGSAPYARRPHGGSAPYFQLPHVGSSYGGSPLYARPTHGGSAPYFQLPHVGSPPYARPPHVGFSLYARPPHVGFSLYARPPHVGSALYVRPPHGGSAPYSQPPHGGSAPYAQLPTGYPYGAPPTEGYDYGYGYNGDDYAHGRYDGDDYGAPPTEGYDYGYGYNGDDYAHGRYDGDDYAYAGYDGLAVGAPAGLLGGLALSEGVDYVEDQIADDVEYRVEDDYADDGYERRFLSALVQPDQNNVEAASFHELFTSTVVHFITTGLLCAW